MNKNFIHAETELLLDTITEQQAQIRSYSGPIPQIELDIILSNIARLYEQITRLKKADVREALPTRVPVSEIIRPVMPEKQVPVNPDTLPEPSEPLVSLVKEKSPIVSFVVRPSFETETKEAPGIIPAAAPAAAPAPVPEAVASSQSEDPTPHIEPEVLSPVAQNQPVIEKPVVPDPPAKEEVRPSVAASRRATIQTMGLFDVVATVAGQYTEQPNLHDKISKNHTDTSLGKKLQEKPVEDLKKSIGINEKFSFINELFDGDLNGYNSTIDLLNSCRNLEDARTIISDQLMPKYAWDTNGNAFINLSNLLDRRFIR